MNDTALRAGDGPPPRTNPPTRRLRAALAVLLCALGLLFAASPLASADSPSAGNDVQVAQTLGDRELTVILRRVTGVPGPLHVDVITHTGTAAGRIRLGAVPTGVATSSSAGSSSGTTTDTAVVTLGASPGTYSAQLEVDEVGPWQLTLDDGTRTAAIPFVVSKQVTSPDEKAVYGGFIGAGLLIPVTVLVAVRARRGWWAVVPAGGIVAGLAVAVTGAILSATLPLPASQGGQVDATIDGVKNPYSSVGQQTSDYSREPATLGIRSSSVRAGTVDDLTFSVTDTSTGLPVDDIVVHDGALVHLIVIGPSGQLWHLHPVMTGAGTYEVPLTLPEAGHYAVSAEFARRGGGVQLVRSATGIDAANGTDSGTGSGSASGSASASASASGSASASASGSAGAASTAVAAVHSGPGTQTVDGVRVRLTASSLVAGKAAVLTARVGGDATLQPWLGMLGHMIVAGPVPSSGTAVGQAAQNAEVWAHSHSMGAVSDDMAGMDMNSSTDMSSMSGLTSVNGDSTADETVAAYGPDISFVYTFPKAGSYRIWIQAERDDTILTVPYLIQVTGATGSTG
ncbi:hypothetical protein [Streptomyces sp. NPDC048277]|uniref:hypothetical protein n=1 Tax=Streptomyces sp. NPDC048277 TaxID=3155027 RepID=UPI0033D155A0